MKIILCLLSLLTFLPSIHGQQFSFQMNFVDAIGNKDSIVLGYDLSATDSIDTSFNEVNIIGLPLNPGLDVRITDEFYYRTSFNTQGTFHTKKQIVQSDCQLTKISTLDIFTQNWPVTVTWDKSIFNDACRNGSVFTSINPGGWWDTGSPSDLWRRVLSIGDFATFTSNADNGLLNYSYLNNAGDTIPVFWQAFADSLLLSLDLTEVSEFPEQLSVFPNPANAEVNLVLPSQFGKVLFVEVYTSFGKLVYSTTKLSSLDFSDYERGVYFIVVVNEEGMKMSKGIVKS